MSAVANSSTMADFEATPKNNFDFEEGKTVQVFHDWLTETKPDAKVTLVQRMWSEKDRDVYGMNTEKWIVKYSDGHELFRFFKTKEK